MGWATSGVTHGLEAAVAVGALVAATRTGTSRKRFMDLDTGAGHQQGISGQENAQL